MGLLVQSLCIAALQLLVLVQCVSVKTSLDCENREQVTEVFVSYDTASDEFRFQAGPDAYTVARASLSNCINSTGFAYLTVSTVSSYTYLQLNSSVQAYAAGLAEGYATKELIAMHYHNIFSGFCDGQVDRCLALAKFLRENLDWVLFNVASNPDDSYWYQVRLFYEQMRGLQDGYNGKPGKISLDVDDVMGIYLLTLSPELDSILLSLFPPPFLEPTLGHCSVLIKVLQDQSGVKDVLISHNTWTDYSSMLRILKRYEFYFRKVPSCSEPVLGHNITFSSYPGTLTSIDDFYVLSSAMVVTETTNQIYNKDLFKKITPLSVLESVRISVANRLAEHGNDWSQTFSAHSSGTYNNQWMVVDFKQYDEFLHTILPGFLTVLEEIPGLIQYKDMTSVLLNTSYWASYNVQYYKETYHASGLPEMVARYGDFFTHDHCPRANIFRRDHLTVNDFKTLTKLMRYNDFQHDPLSKCNCTPPYSACNAISARNDLNAPNGTYPFHILGFGLLGATDLKLTSITMAMDTLTFMAISGPTYDPQIGRAHV